MKYVEIIENKLPIAKPSFKNIKSNYGAFIVSMPPMLFLKLTTENDESIKTILNSVTQNIQNYKNNIPPNAENDHFIKNNHFYPFLQVEYPSGKITGHEGRHRAAMVYKEGGKTFPCVIYMYEDSKYKVIWKTYNLETDDHEDHEQVFDTKQEAQTFATSIKNEDNYNIRVEKEIGYLLKGNPDRATGEWDRKKWKVTDFPSFLTGQYNPSIKVPKSELKIGIVKAPYYND